MIATAEGKVVVSLNTDAFVASYKGAPPICSFEERASVLGSCKFVDEVIPNIGGADSKIAIASVNPDFIVVGSDWENKDYHSQMQFSADWLLQQGVVLKFVPYTNAISTTVIKSRLT